MVSLCRRGTSPVVRMAHVLSPKDSGQASLAADPSPDGKYGHVTRCNANGIPIVSAYNPYQCDECAANSPRLTLQRPRFGRGFRAAEEVVGMYACPCPQHEQRE